MDNHLLNYSTFTIIMPCDWDCSFIILSITFSFFFVDNSKLLVSGLLEIHALILIFSLFQLCISASCSLFNCQHNLKLLHKFAPCFNMSANINITSC